MKFRNSVTHNSTNKSQSFQKPGTYDIKKDKIIKEEIKLSLSGRSFLKIVLNDKKSEGKEFLYSYFILFGR